MILVLDNYDSFTWNLVHYLAELGETVEVRRNDEVTVEQAMALPATGILISPGPKTPDEAGITLGLVQAAAQARRPVLGVCLGHQAIGQLWGGRVIRGGLMHGKTSAIAHDGTGVFAGLPDPFAATRYHSLVVDAPGPELVVNARSNDGLIMGLRHRNLPIHGVQFHPESIATDHGHDLLANWLETTR